MNNASNNCAKSLQSNGCNKKHGRLCPCCYPCTPLKRKFAQFRLVTPTLGERLKEILKRFDIKIKEAVHKTGLSEAIIDRLRNDRNTTHDIRTMVKLCAGLDLPPNISNELFGLAGVSLKIAKIEIFAYNHIINGMYGQTAEEKEKYLEENGLQRLDIQD